jgi:hypothetical protein
MHKYVISTTLTEAPWKESTIIRENVVAEIARLKQQPGKDIIIDGSATLVQSLQGTGLIDEYRFLVEPFIMGRGRRFFAEGTAMTKLRLVESKTLDSGTLALIYQPSPPALFGGQMIQRLGIHDRSVLRTASRQQTIHVPPPMHGKNPVRHAMGDQIEGAAVHALEHLERQLLAAMVHQPPV